MKYSLYIPALIVLFSVSVLSCSKKPVEPIPEATGKVSFTMSHLVNDQTLVKNEMTYQNEAGNQYLITELKYFISDITFFKHDGTHTQIHLWQDIFYIDDELPSSKTIDFFDPVPAGDYDSINFIFGITAPKNQSFMYVNPPESTMFWPEILGGGYHYLMLNGKWLDTTGVTQPFDFHLGIGQLYHGTGYNTDSIYAYVQNYFPVSLKHSEFSIRAGETITFNVQMNIESWFRTPHVYDHNHWGGAIMQNQAAMQTAKENGYDVFTITQIK